MIAGAVRGDSSFAATALELEYRKDINDALAHPMGHLLGSWGCLEMQGYLFARPMPTQQVAGLLRRGATLPLTDGAAPFPSAESC